jgi:hypothetical protein
MGSRLKQLTEAERSSSRLKEECYRKQEGSRGGKERVNWHVEGSKFRTGDVLPKPIEKVHDAGWHLWDIY